MDHDDDLATLQTFGDDDAGAYDPYADADDEWAAIEPREPTAEEIEAADRDEAEHIDRDFAPFQAAADKAVALLRAHGIVASAELDGDVDDDTGRTMSWHLLYVDCHKGCRPVADIGMHVLEERDCDCEAQEGAESVCQRAIDLLAADGAFRDGWAS